MAIANQTLCYSHCILNHFGKEHMSYVNAKDVLPDSLVQEIQKYVDGQNIYIPRIGENTKSWGEKSGTRDKLTERNQKIVELYYSGESISKISKTFFLSDKTVQGIIHKAEVYTNMKRG